MTNLMGKEDDHYLIDGSKEVGNTEILDQIGFNSIHLFNFKAQYAVIDEREETYHLYTSQSNLRTVKVKCPKIIKIAIIKFIIISGYPPICQPYS